MPISVRLDEHLPNTLYWSYEGKWSWQEFHENFERAFQIVERQPAARWDVIALQCNLVLPPGDPIKHADIEFRRAVERNIKLLVAVTDSALFVTLSKLGVALFPHYRDLIRVTNTVEHGYELIRQDRARTRIVSA